MKQPATVTPFKDMMAAFADIASRKFTNPMPTHSPVFISVFAVAPLCAMAPKHAKI